MPQLRLTLLLLIISTVAAAAQSAVPQLRDITVRPSGSTATITLLFTGRVTTVVVEPKGNGVAQVRMKSVRADEKALTSAVVKPGLRSVRAHIERTDVLVANVTFTQTVASMTVTKRDSVSVVVLVKLRPNSPASAATTSAAKPTKKESSKTAPDEPPDTSPKAGNTDNNTADNRTDNALSRKRWALNTIIIDPGHGGKDPGALGIGEVKEKDVTLATSKKIREELKKLMPGVKVLLTREDDAFVELYQRGQIANKAGGKLFISIHCNSMPEKPHPASGFECYILRPGRSTDAARVALRENSVIQLEYGQERYAGMTTETTIMAAMAQSAFARFSETLAQRIRESVRTTDILPDRGVHQAGFLVLVGASMPSVLVELGYLSNEHDAELLGSKTGQRSLARSVAKGIQRYAQEYEAIIKEQ
ncbi:MAG: N-acetylmuramoyl-L-alanine amidase [Armatimonadetes bacterium]|nr:N-acetylmuramoyl-L-alanine amidase [Armatimonadota bacterium]